MHSKGKPLLLLGALLVAALGVCAWACDPPGGIINSPGGGATVSGATSVEVGITKSETPVVGVDIYVDDSLLASVAKGTDNVYSYDWDTTKVKNGPHKLYAKIRATGRKDGVTPTVSVTVKN